MPPFGNEGAERESKAIPWLAFSSRDVKRPRRSAPSCVFGAEPAEADVDGGLGCAKTSKMSSASSASSKPFQQEEEERSVKPTRMTPFADEAVEAGYESSPGSNSGDEEFDMKSDSVFSLGWQSVITLQKAGFWRKHEDDERSKKKKRAYDNSKRSSEAMYLSREKRGAFARNGSDPGRLQALLSTKCHCACLRLGFKHHLCL